MQIILQNIYIYIFYNLLLQFRKFRTYPIAITGNVDICLQISVDDRDLLQFLWLKNLFNKHRATL